MPPKQIVMIMQDNYPFGECQNCTNQNTRVLVRKIYQVNSQQRSKLLEKMKTLRKLKNQNMIKIESVLQEEDSIHFLFQYIPIKLETWISNINDQFIENFRDQIIKFSAFLANNFIKIDFQLKNIGMDQNYGAKYFLDLNFVVDSTINRQKLRSNYIREITNIFKPYISSENAIQQPFISTNQKSSKEISKVTGSNKGQQNTSISPPTNKKQKTLQKYYQQVNMSVDSESDKILQEFMDVLDNDEATNEAPQTITPPFELKVKSQNPQLFNQFQKQDNSQQPFSVNKTKNYQPKSSKLIEPNTQVYHTSPSKNITPSSQKSYQVNNKFQSLKNIPYQSNYITEKQSELKQISQTDKEGINLQNRIKSAIQKSMDAIKKFKAIKDNPQI